MAVATRRSVVLEPASQEFVEATSTPPFLYELTPDRGAQGARRRPGRADRQAAGRRRWITVPGRGRRRARAHRAAAGRRRDAAGDPLHARRRLGARERRTRTTGSSASSPSAPAPPSSSSSTTARPRRTTPSRSSRATPPPSGSCARAPPTGSTRSGIAVAGDSVGGSMTAALALMASERGDVRFVQQSMYYPVTDAAMDTDSYEQFAEGYFLTAKGMAWFWDAYLPDVERRSEPYASPLRASDEQLAGLPPAFLIVDEADVLRDEGEAYAARLRAAGVAVTTVRYDGITHDFMMLNPLSDTHATRAAVAQAIAVLRDALRELTPHRQRVPTDSGTDCPGGRRH